MSYKKPEVRGLAYHMANHFITAGEMRRQGWVIKARCPTCHLDAWVCLSTLIRLSGPEVRLFGRTTRCRRYGCLGRMIFMATPPGEQAGLFWPLMKPKDADADPQLRRRHDAG